VEVPSFVEHRVSRGVRQRLGRSRRVALEVNESVTALNQLAGFNFASNEPCSAAQSASLDHLRSVISSEFPTAFPETTKESVSAILGTTHNYGCSDISHLASYDPELLSVPSVGAHPVSSAQHLPDEARNFLVHFAEHLLVSDEEWGAGCEANVPITNYIDPKLNYSKTAYHAFVGTLYKAGLLRWSRSCRGRVGFFFVKKKNGSIRLVIDCRAVNRCFRRCPHVPLGTGAAWSEVIMDDSCDMYLSLSDIKYYFYECEIPAELSEYFCMADVPVRISCALTPRNLIKAGLIV
jgi:hypothetical protein